MKEKVMRIMALAALLCLGACAITPEQRTRAALADAGVPPRIAACMAKRMTRKLTIPQLLELRSLSHARGEDGHFSAHEFARRLERLDDPEVVLVTGGAAIRCAVAD